MYRHCVSNLFKVESICLLKVLFFTPVHRPKHSQGTLCTMASLGREELPQAQSVFDNPFSIKSILNLSEEPQENFAQISNENSRPMFPVVPQAMRPPVAFNMGTGLACYSTAQWLSAASNFPPWLFGTRFMRFLPGKRVKAQR